MKKLVVSVALALLAVPALAHAEAKYTRKQSVQIPVTLSDRTKPTAPAPTPPAKPIITANDVMKIEEVTQPFRLEQEGILENLIAETADDDPDKPELMFRLAEQFAKQQRFWRLKSVDAAIKAERR